MFARWAGAVGAEAYDLPGRGRRAAEPPLTSFDALAADAADFSARVGARWLLGHSFGAWLAVAVASRLGSTLDGVFVASSRPPSSASRAPRHDASSRFLRRYFGALGAWSREALEDEDLMHYVETLLRQDLRFREDAVARPAPRLDLPIVVLSGRSDTSVPPGSVDEWAAMTDAAVCGHQYEGGHFFLFDDPKVLSDVRNHITTC
jgi:medium-chain acyl-[acyl-carrier-protein] hydrolase